MKTVRLLSALCLLTIFMVASRAQAQTIQALTNQLADLAGNQVSVSALGANKVTVVSFWATWCKPCKEEMKAMQPVYERLKGNGLQYIAISIDDTKTMAKVAPYIASKKYTFNVLLDPNKDLFKSLNGTDVPFTVIFNADGTLHAKHDGYLEGDEVKLEQELNAMLVPSDTAR